MLSSNLFVPSIESAAQLYRDDILWEMQHPMKEKVKFERTYYKISISVFCCIFSVALAICALILAEGAPMSSIFF